MLNRRFLRIKVMQALYSFFQHETGDTAQFEKEMFRNLDKIYDLYLHILALLADLRHVSLLNIEENRNKRLPSQEDLNPSLRFPNNSLLKALAESNELKKELERRKISWQNDFSVVRKLYTDLRHTKLFKSYVAAPQGWYPEDRQFVIQLITEFLSKNETLISLFEEKSMHWADDLFVAYNSAIRTFDDFNGEFSLSPLLKDEADDRAFMSTLFNKTIMYRAQFDEMIDRHAANWELERIASMDMLLMEMAICEFLHLPNVPVKASLNEYIDISKEYSTPSSRFFINGVLDKIIAELKRENKIEKSGRGLKES
jgi:transcription antitermination protein NusB